MMNAYSEIYLDDAADNIGEMVDVAINDLEIRGSDFLDMFVTSGVAGEIESGNPKYIAGMSGAELAIEVTRRTLNRMPRLQLTDTIYKTPQFWVGWALCRYQHHTGRKFGDILSTASYEELEGMYNTLHEADISKFISEMDRIRSIRKKETKLSIIRKNTGYSQAELVKRSGVSLRSIQMYEQKNKDINKAASLTVGKLAVVCACRIEDLLEI